MSLHVLAIDDDPTILQMVKDILQAHGHTVTTAPDAETGLQILQTTSAETPSFDLIVSDIMMPGMTGLELLQAVKIDPKLSKIPVILLTAEKQPEDIMRGYTYGADYYIEKPFAAKQLVQGVALLFPDQ